MKLTTRGRYAVTAMLDLALQAQGPAVTLAELARRNRLSSAYLEQLLASLRRAGLVDSARGPGGGYRLARPPAEITVAQVIAMVNEDVDATRCGGARDCHDGGPCLTHDLWEDLTRHVQDFLASVTLAQLCVRHAQRAQPSRVVPLRRLESARVATLSAK